MRQLTLGPRAIVALATLASTASPMALAEAQDRPSPPPAAQVQPAPPSRSAPGADPSSAATQSAVKLAGLVTFVANACPKLQPNYARFTEAIAALGLAKADLDRADLKGRYLGYAARYNTDIKTSCERAAAQFGPNGATLAGIFDPR